MRPISEALNQRFRVVQLHSESIGDPGIHHLALDDVEAEKQWLVTRQAPRQPSTAKLLA